jgi:hypothetical protein
MGEQLLFNESEIPLARSGWHGSQRWPGLPNRWAAWSNRAYPGVTVRHCCHPTAIRPYWIDGMDIPRKFRRLADAKASVEAGRDILSTTEGL